MPASHPRHGTVTARIAAVLITTTSLLVASFIAPFGAALAGEDVIVEMRLMHFTPERVVAKTGSTIVFVNNDTFDYPGVGGNHRVIAENGTFDTGNVAPGARAARTFNEPMTTSFFCTIHPNVMQGTLTVEGKPVKPKVSERTVTIVEPKPNEPKTWGYDPAAVTLDVGGKVTWRNNGAVAHTVTADDGSFDKRLAPGEKITIAFPEAKAIRYSCAPHPWMKGSVKVGAAKLAPAEDAEKGTTQPGPIATVAPPPADAGPQTFNVSAVEPDAADPMGWGFAPQALTMRVDDTVIWKNDGAQPHTVTADDGTFDANLQPGATFKFTATDTKTITYSCKPHPWMKGTVKIIAAGVADVGAAPVPKPAQSQDGANQTPGHEQNETSAGAVNDPRRVMLAISTGAIIALYTAAFLLAGALANRPRKGKDDDAPAGEHVDEETAEMQRELVEV